MTKNGPFGARIGAAGFIVMVGALLSELGCSGSEPPKPAAATMPGSSGATCPDAAPTYDGFAKDFFASYCVRCHASDLVGSARRGAPGFANFDTRSGIEAASADILDQLAAAGPLQQNTFMPPDEPSPSLDERQSLGQWLACGLP